MSTRSAFPPGLDSCTLPEVRCLLVLWALLGCAEPRVFLAYPDGFTAETAILGQRRPLALWVLGEGAFELGFEGEAPEFALLGYDASHEALRLRPGPLEVGATCRACALRSPSRFYAAESGGEFAALADPPPWLLDALIPDAAERCAACPVQLTSQLLPNPIGSAPRYFYLLPWTPTQLLYVDAAARLARLSSDGALEPLCLEGDGSWPQLSAAMTAGGEELWFTDPSGTLWSARLDELDPSVPCSASLQQRSPPLGLLVLRLAGPADQSTPSIHALVDEGGDSLGLYWFDGQSWSLVTSVAWGGDEPSMVHGSDGWTHVVMGTNEILHARGAEFRAERVERGVLERQLTAVGDLPGFGLVYLDRYDFALVEDGRGGYRTLGDLAIVDRDGDRLRGLVAFGEGILIGTSRGEVRYFDLDYGYCAPQRGVFGQENARNMRALSGGVVFSGMGTLYRGTESTECPR